MKNFTESITDFEELPKIMEKAKAVMGVKGVFAKDTLSIEIQGPNRPQLTLVDIPGLIQSSTKGVSDEDMATVAEITTHYIKQHRTICLAVVAATNDAANQPILKQVLKFDPNGERTLGVITKADLLPADSGAETAFLELARNEDVFFSLGWHVVKNRKFEEKEFSIEECNLSASTFFKTSSFRTLPEENRGIDSLRLKLSRLLFDHVKIELPRLQSDLETALTSAKQNSERLGPTRCSVTECRSSLAEINMKSYELCKAGISGHYENNWFKQSKSFIEGNKIPIQRIRAAIQLSNTNFAENFRTKGHKFYFSQALDLVPGSSSTGPKSISKAKALAWVKKKLQESRGIELVGNYNPGVIGELFWEQSEPWEKLATDHAMGISAICEKFVSLLLDSLVFKDVKPIVWTSMVLPALRQHRQARLNELRKLLNDSKDFPLNYNHYNTDTVHKQRFKRLETKLMNSAPKTPTTITDDGKFDGNDYIRTAASVLSVSVGPDMEEFSCEEALDCLLAIYKVKQKTLIDNVVTQVVERHIVRGLHEIFSPMVAVNMLNSQVESMLSEPQATPQQRASLTDLVKKLEEGQEIFRDVVGT